MTWHDGLCFGCEEPLTVVALSVERWTNNHHQDYVEFCPACVTRLDVAIDEYEHVSRTREVGV